MTAIPAAGAARTSVATRLILFLAAYFALQAILRLLAVSSLGLDDAEMVVITQSLQPGYGSQPPLYNWLQVASFAVFGFGMPAIVILHFVLLFAVYILVFLSARIVLDDEIKAAAVSLGLFAIPQIGWEALHSHTHTLLSLTLAAATLLAMLRVLARGSWLDYVILGVLLRARRAGQVQLHPVCRGTARCRSDHPGAPGPGAVLAHGGGDCHRPHPPRPASPVGLDPHRRDAVADLEVQDRRGCRPVPRPRTELRRDARRRRRLHRAVGRGLRRRSLPAAPERASGRPRTRAAGAAAWPRLRPPRARGRARHRARCRAGHRRHRGQGALAAADPVHAAARPDDPRRASPQPAPRAAAGHHPGGDRRSSSW